MPAQTETNVFKFTNLLALELEVQIAKSAFDERPLGCPVATTDRLLKQVKQAKKALYAAVDDLSIEEGRAYAQFRIQE